METLMVKIEKSDKADMLVELLKSMDFVTSVENYENYSKFKATFEDINKFSANTELSEMTMEEINNEIKAFRSDKKSNSN